MQAAFGTLIWSLDLFFDFEVVFHVLFQLGTEESTRYGQISISALGLDRDLGFSRGHQGHWPHDDDNDQEEDNKVEDNDKDENNDKDLDNNKDSNVIRVSQLCE